MSEKPWPTNPVVTCLRDAAAHYLNEAEYQGHDAGLRAQILNEMADKVERGDYGRTPSEPVSREAEPETGYVVDGGWLETRREYAPTLQEAIDKYRAKHNRNPDGFERIEGDEVGEFVGACEGCNRMILEGEKYAFDPEDVVYECANCRTPEPVTPLSEQETS